MTGEKAPVLSMNPYMMWEVSIHDDCIVSGGKLDTVNICRTYVNDLQSVIHTKMIDVEYHYWAKNNYQDRVCQHEDAIAVGGGMGSNWRWASKSQ